MANRRPSPHLCLAPCGPGAIEKRGLVTYVLGMATGELCQPVALGVLGKREDWSFHVRQVLSESRLGLGRLPEALLRQS